MARISWPSMHDNMKTAAGRDGRDKGTRGQGEK
jgi:hypothetical protein